MIPNCRVTITHPTEVVSFAEPEKSGEVVVNIAKNDGSTYTLSMPLYEWSKLFGKGTTAVAEFKWQNTTLPKLTA